MYPGALDKDVFCGIYGRFPYGYFPFYLLFHFIDNKCKALLAANFKGFY